MRHTCFLLLVALLLATAHPAVGDEPALVSIALTGATIHTNSAPGSFVGTVVIQHGRITAVGPSVNIPPGMKTVDVTGCVITPGLIDAHGTLGLNAAAASESGRDATLNILDAVDPFSDDWRDAARQGVTAVYVQPGSGGNLGGSGAVLRVSSGDGGNALALRSPAGIQMSLGLMPTAPAQTNDQLRDLLARRGIQLPAANQPPAAPPPSTTLTRFAQYEQVRALFTSAKQYGSDKPAKRDAVKELLLRAIKGEVPIRVQVNHEDDLRNALKLGSEFGLAMVFETIEKAQPIPDEFRKQRNGLVLGPVSGAKPTSAMRQLALDGRLFAIGTFGAEGRDSAGLRLHAAAAVAGGFPRDRVLRAITHDAAELLGVGDKMGRIAAGRAADLAVFAGDPLDASVPVRMTISQGIVTYEDASVTAVSAPTTATVSLPSTLPSSFTIKTTRLLRPSGEFTPGELKVQNGRIVDRHEFVADAAVFDLGDVPVTPGLVAAHVAIPGEAAPDADAANLRAVDAVTSGDPRLRQCRDAGFLTTIVAPGSNNVLAGMCGLIGGNDTATKPDVAFKFVLTASARSAERFPASLAGQVELIDARLAGEPLESTTYLPRALQMSLAAERDRVLAEVKSRRIPASFEVQTRSEIQAALRLIAEHRLRGVLLLPRDVPGLVGDIQAAGVTVVVGPVKARDAQRLTQGIVELGKAGVPLSFAGDPDEMRTSAAWLVNAGLPRATARKAFLGQPGESLGLPASAGRLQPGDPADIVVWTGDILDSTSRPAAVIARGERQAASAAGDVPAGDERRPAGSPTRAGRRSR